MVTSERNNKRIIMQNSKRIISIFLLIWLIGLVLLSQTACLKSYIPAKEADSPIGYQSGKAEESTRQESYSANLIAKSDNTLSSQEKETVLKEIADELDYIMNVVQSLEIADTD